MDKTDLALGFAWYVVFVCSTVLHEAAHAYTSWKLGDPTAYQGGQVTLDPRPHIRREPVGMVVVPILSFILGGWMIGWASAPYDRFWAYRYPRRAAVMALAGPAANLFLAVAAGLVIRLALAARLFPAETEGFLHGAGTVLVIAFTLNLILFVFNLLPLPPLDGSAAVPLLLRERAARRYLEFLWHPTFSLLGIVVAWRLFDEVFPPVYRFAFEILFG